MEEVLDKKIKIDLSIRDALRIVFVLAKTNGLDCSAYSAITQKLNKFGSINKTLMGFIHIDGIDRLNYYNIQDEVERNFLNTKKNQEEIEELQLKVADMLIQIEDLKNAQ